MLPAVVTEDAAARSIVAATVLLPLFLPLFYVLGVVSIPALLAVLAAGLVLLYLTMGTLRDSRAARSSFRFSGIFLMIALLVVAVDALALFG